MPQTAARDGSGLRSLEKFDDLIRQMIESDAFRMAPVMQALLLYLWQNQGRSISEYAIATDALGRAASFDPKADSTVRVQVARLRSKLKEFYEGAGESFPLRLDLPRGGHELKWTYQPPRKSIASKLNGLPKSYLWSAGLVGLFLVIVCASLLIETHLLKASLPPPPAPLPRIWQSFLVAGKPTEIVVPSPLYFTWPTHGIILRDFAISDFNRGNTSPLIRQATKEWGPPQLSQIYVGAAEMTAGINVLQYLEKAGQQVRLIESRRFPTALFAAQNTIFLGMPRNAGYLNQILAKTNYYMANADPDVIKSRNPRPGEEEEYREIAYSADRRKAPAIIILLPPSQEHTRMLLLLGKYITATTSMLLTYEGRKLIDEAWVKAGSPNSWEMVVETEINDDAILKFAALSCRPISENFWR